MRDDGSFITNLASKSPSDRTNIVRDRFENMLREERKSLIKEDSEFKTQSVSLLNHTATKEQSRKKMSANQIKQHSKDKSIGQEKEEDIISENEFTKKENLFTDETKNEKKFYENEETEENSLRSDNVPNCKEEMGKQLRDNNDKICEYICNLKHQREELIFIIEKQYEERKKLETEMERITYKLCLINKSMAQRIKTKNLYDETIQEIEANYSKLIQDSEAILALIKSQYDNLDGLINKKTSTDETLLTAPDEQASGEPPTYQNKDCNCHIRIKEAKERSRKSPRTKSGRICFCVNKIIKQEDDTD